MKEHIDKIIQASETERPIELRSELWDRLDRQLDSSERLESSLQQKKRTKRRRIAGSKWLAAASLALILTIVTSFYLQMHSYTIMDLKTSSEPYFTKEDLSELEHYYDNPDRLLLNTRTI